MLVTNHVLVGAAIGYSTKKPAASYAFGFLSHFIMDALPHWGDVDTHQEFMKVAVKDGLAGLAALGLLIKFAPLKKRRSVLMGALGAATPDLDKPSQVFFSFSPFPSWLDDFHGRIQRESKSRMPQELLFGLVVAGALKSLFKPEV